MKIKCKFYGFPDIEKRIGGKEIETEIEGETIGDRLSFLNMIAGG